MKGVPVLTSEEKEALIRRVDAGAGISGISGTGYQLRKYKTPL